MIERQVIERRRVTVTTNHGESLDAKMKGRSEYEMRLFLKRPVTIGSKAAVTIRNEKLSGVVMYCVHDLRVEEYVIGVSLQPHAVA